MLNVHFSFKKSFQGNELKKFIKNESRSVFKINNILTIHLNNEKKTPIQNEVTKYVQLKMCIVIIIKTVFLV